MLHEAIGSDRECIENLMQFYNYELSAWYPIDIGAKGQFCIRSKSTYWAQDHVQPYLLRVGGALAGFAVVDGETQLSTSRYNLGYLFVARRFRGQGVGKAAFEQLLTPRPGAWEVYHLAKNRDAAGFWSSLFRDAGIQPERVVIDNEASVIYRFASPLQFSGTAQSCRTEACT